MKKLLLLIPLLALSGCVSVTNDKQSVNNNSSETSTVSEVSEAVWQTMESSNWTMIIFSGSDKRTLGSYQFSSFEYRAFYDNIVFELDLKYVLSGYTETTIEIFRGTDLSYNIQYHG